jgi:hypothetical protein
VKEDESKVKAEIKDEIKVKAEIKDEIKVKADTTKVKVSLSSDSEAEVSSLVLQ